MPRLFRPFSLVRTRCQPANLFIAVWPVRENAPVASRGPELRSGWHHGVWLGGSGKPQHQCSGRRVYDQGVCPRRLGRCVRGWTDGLGGCRAVIRGFVRFGRRGRCLVAGPRSSPQSLLTFWRRFTLIASLNRKRKTSLPIEPSVTDPRRSALRLPGERGAAPCTEWRGPILASCPAVLRPCVL